MMRSDIYFKITCRASDLPRLRFYVHDRGKRMRSCQDWRKTHIKSQISSLKLLVTNAFKASHISPGVGSIRLEARTHTAIRTLRNLYTARLRSLLPGGVRSGTSETIPIISEQWTADTVGVSLSDAESSRTEFYCFVEFVSRSFFWVHFGFDNLPWTRKFMWWMKVIKMR